MDWAALAPPEAQRRGYGRYSCEVPPGSILPYAGKDCPPGFLPCDGRAVPRLAYRKLHDAIGDAFGSGRFIFRVPDLRARVRTTSPNFWDVQTGRANYTPTYESIAHYVIRT